jgi:hypothetical protein
MHIVRGCQDHALVLLQIAREHPDLKDEATYLAHEWLAAAAVRISSGRFERPEKEVPPN